VLGFVLMVSACGAGAAQTEGVEPVRPTNGVGIERSAELTSGDQPEAGHRLIHRYTITNTGSVGLAQIQVNDPAVGPIECPLEELAPDADRLPPFRGESMVCEESGQLSQADIDRGEVPLEASVVATTADGERVEDSDRQSLALRADAELNITVTTEPHLPEDGEEVLVRILAQNEGEVTLTNVEIELPGVIGLLECNPPGRPSVPPQGIVVCLGTAIAPIGEVLASSDQALGATDGTNNRRAVLAIKRAGTLAGGDATLPKAGDAVVYSYEITNLGGRPVSGLVVEDDRAEAVSCGATEVAGGEKVSCTAQTAVTQFDIDTGFVASSAVAAGVDSENNPISAESLHTLPLESTGGLSLVLTTASPKVPFGGTATVTAQVTNTGNATLEEVKVVFFAHSECGREFSGIGAGDTRTWPCTVPNTASDLLLTAQADAPIGNGEWASVKSELVVDALPRMRVEVRPADSDLRTGGFVGYTVIVTNTGGESDPLNVTTITDSAFGNLLDPANPKIVGTSCNSVAALASGFSYDCWFQISLAATPAGQLQNQLSVVGFDDERNEVRASATTTVYID